MGKRRTALSPAVTVSRGEDVVGDWAATAGRPAEPPAAPREYGDRERQAMQVAYLTDQGLQQLEIAERLDLSQPEVSRLLGYAKQNGWYKFELRLPDNLVDEIGWSVFRRRDELLALLRRQGEAQGSVRLDAVQVVFSDGRDEQKAGVKRFGELAAAYIARRLKHASTCAIAWGRTINSVVDGISGLTPGDGWRHLRFFPTSGEPINHRDTGISATEAAKRLATYFRCEHRALSLSGVATRIPRECTSAEQKAIRKFIAKCNDYRTIFDESSGMMLSAEAVLTGIGDAASSEDDPLFKETRELENLQPNWLNERCVGNLGGVWLAKPGKKSDHEVEDMNERWLGIQARHFEKCGERAVKERKPGVIVVAVGAKKADILRRALGKINHLVIDHHLANALLPPESPNP